jgi:hypothetical protein
MGQPEHFLSGRQYGVFVVTVPKSFPPNDRIVWTISVDGQANSIPLWRNPDYNISPLTGIGRNTPPTLRFVEDGSSLQGPAATVSRVVTRSVRLAEKLTLDVWVEDDLVATTDTGAPPPRKRPPVSLIWTKYRGPGTVTFDPRTPSIDRAEDGKAFRGKSVTTATFSAPGEYMLHATANDYSGVGGGGFQCCWTTALQKVTVIP